MNREAAIEAAAQALDPLAWRGRWANPELQRYAQGIARERATLAIDAALPHLAPALKAEAQREAADLVYGDNRALGPHGHPLSVASWLHALADRIERGDA